MRRSAPRRPRCATPASRARPARIGITNQRETTVLWDRATGRPVAPAIVWQDRRTAERCAELPAELLRARTGLVPDPYFSATKLEWLLRARRAPARARLRHGRHVARVAADGRAARHRRDQRVADAAARPRHARVGRRAARALRRRARAAAERRRARRRSSARASSSARRCRSPGMAGDQQAALFGQGCFAPGRGRRPTGRAASCSSTPAASGRRRRTGCS